MIYEVSPHPEVSSLSVGIGYRRRRFLDEQSASVSVVPRGI